MNFFSKKTKMLVLLILLVIAVAVLYRAFTYTSAPAILDEPSVRAAYAWLAAADRNDRSAMSKLVSPQLNAEQIVTQFMNDYKNLGASQGRELRQRCIRNDGKVGNYYEIDFYDHFSHQRNSVNLKVYVITADGKNFGIAGARYAIPLPTPTRDGLTQLPDYADGSPEKAAQLWFGRFDRGDLDDCSRLALVRREFQDGSLAAWRAEGPAVLPFRDWLRKMHPGPPPLKRTLAAVQLWRDLPGAAGLEIAGVFYQVEYPGKKRQERLWLLKDPYTGSTRWLPYAVRFNDQSAKKKPAAPVGK